MSSSLLSSKKNYDRKLIDAGSYGKVYKITSKSDNSTYAMKKISLKKKFIAISERKAALADAINEFDLYKKNIPNVLRSYESHYDQTKEVYRFSTDLMERNLLKLIIENGDLDFENFIPIFTDILSGK